MYGELVDFDRILSDTFLCLPKDRYAEIAIYGTDFCA